MFDCDKKTIISNKEINISISRKQTPKENKDNIKNNNEINEDNIKIISNNDINNNLLSKNKVESIFQSNINNNPTLNSSIINKKDIEEDSKVISENKNVQIKDNQNIKEEKNNNLDINETPNGINIFQEPPSISENSPPENQKKEPESDNTKKIIKKKERKNKDHKKKEIKTITSLTPIPEYPTLNNNYDISMRPGKLIINFHELPQSDKITEVENNLGGEFIIDQKELYKKMEEYPYTPRSYSISYPSGEIYKGYYSPEWVKEVFGIHFDKNGNKYVGMFKNGVFEGKGRLILHRGDYYEGEFMDNKANGLGKFVNSKGEIYNGQWVNDKQEGEGELILKDGSIYFGQFKNGKKNGKGKINWSDNSYYEGEFVNNYYEGYGVYILMSKRKGYIGEWKEGKMNGFGVFFWADGRSYKGYFESDKKHGFGIYSGKNNLRYEGKFKKGKQYGIGRIINEKGERQLGLYVKGKRLKYLNENDFKEDIENIDLEIEKINNKFNKEEFFVKNKDLMNITLDQT